MDLNNQLLQLMMEKYVYLFQTLNFLDFFGGEVYNHVIILQLFLLNDSLSHDTLSFLLR